MEEGDLVLANNIWFDFCNGDELNGGADGIIRVTSDAEDTNAQFLIDHLTANNNTLENPALNSISRVDDNGFDPRPAAGGAAFQNLGTIPANSFFENSDHKGAFGAFMWLNDWTALDTYGVLAEIENEETIRTAIEEIEIQDKGYSLIQNNPNPTSNTTQIGFTLSTKKNISLTVFDYTGKEITRLIDNDLYPAGLNTVDLDVTNLANGVYFYTLNNEEVVLTKQLVVLK